MLVIDGEEILKIINLEPHNFSECLVSTINYEMLIITI